VSGLVTDEDDDEDDEDDDDDDDDDELSFLVSFLVSFLSSEAYVGVVALSMISCEDEREATRGGLWRTGCMVLVVVGMVLVVVGMVLVVVVGGMVLVLVVVGMVLVLVVGGIVLVLVVGDVVLLGGCWARSMSSMDEEDDREEEFILSVLDGVLFVRIT
jgi:hypothetical protein